MIYHIPASDDPLDSTRRTSFSKCPILSLTEFDLEEVKAPQIDDR